MITLKKSKVTKTVQVEVEEVSGVTVEMSKEDFAIFLLLIGNISPCNDKVSKFVGRYFRKGTELVPCVDLSCSLTWENKKLFNELVEKVVAKL